MAKENLYGGSFKRLNYPHSLAMMLYSRDIKNILLIHVNAFTTEMMDDLLTAYENHGVNFISLEDALADDAYAVNPDIVRNRAYTFPNQVRLFKKLENPPAVASLYASLPEEELNNLCR